MTISYTDPLRWCRMLCVLASVALSACAGGEKPAYYPEPDPQSYFNIMVGSGDTLSEIAYRYQVDGDVLMAMNDIDDPNDIAAGTAIKISSYGHLREQSDAYLNPIMPRPKPEIVRGDGDYAWNRANEIPIPQPKPIVAAYEPPAQQSSWWGGWFDSSTEVTAAPLPVTAPAPAPTQASVSSKTLASSSGFIWPVSGQVLSGFGAGHGGERNDGINIAAARGTPVRAAAAGTITYVGNELKGYGNLVLIRHDNGYVTAYAHSDSVTVERGERVEQGQVIAYAGATGDVSQPQLHFELRQGTKPVNPATYLVASD